MYNVIQAHVTQYGHWLTQNAFSYEVRMTSKKPDAKWRSNHVIMAIAKSVEDAIAMCVAQYPDDPIIDQVCLRNRSKDLILSGDVVELKTARGTIELTDEILQDEPLGYLVFAAGGDKDFGVFTDLVDAEHYAADQQEESEADGWPIYPLYAGHALDWGV